MALNWFGRIRNRIRGTRSNKKPVQEPQGRTRHERELQARRRWLAEIQNHPRMASDPYPRISGGYREAFLKLPIASKKFAEACRARKQDPRQVFEKMLSELENEKIVEPIWLRAERTFNNERERIAKENLAPAQKIAAEKNALEQIFAIVMNTPKEQ